MRHLISLTIIFCLALLTTSCGGGEASEISDFRLKSASASSIAVRATAVKQTQSMNVSFVGNCVTIASAKKLLNIVMVTTKGEVTLTNLHKRSGMFCSPNGGDITSIWVSTEDKSVSKHNKIGGGASRSAIAQK